MIGRLPECASCRGPIRPSDPQVRCHFRRTGFRNRDGDFFQPCGSVYHRYCFRAGTPFTTRREQGRGLGLPPLRHWPCFVCELCTVRSVVGRELGSPGDLWLLRLERMRILDSVHGWAWDTIKNYQGYLGRLHAFEKEHPGLHILSPQDFGSPPGGPDIGVMWAELHYSVQPLKTPSRTGQVTPSVQTVRQMRSAAGQFLGVNTIMANPGGEAYFDKRRLLRGNVRPTDGAAYTLFSKGMASRMGDQTVPSTALLGRHIRGLDDFFEARFMSATQASVRQAYATAGLANLMAWTTWLRGGELFRLNWENLDIIWPQQALQRDLPANTGAILLRLSPETKSSRTATAEIAVALRTVTGLDLARWLRRVRAAAPVPPRPADAVFGQYNGQRWVRWTSHHYRHKFLYPGLEFLRAGGDTFLTHLGGREGRMLPRKFFSIHSYRRGARSHAQRSQPTIAGHRKAPDTWIYEHGRWRLQRSSEPIAVQYREWTLYERLRLTLFSM